MTMGIFFSSRGAWLWLQEQRFSSHRSRLHRARWRFHQPGWQWPDVHIRRIIWGWEFSGTARFARYVFRPIEPLFGRFCQKLSVVSEKCSDHTFFPDPLFKIWALSLNQLRNCFTGPEYTADYLRMIIFWYRMIHQVRVPAHRATFWPVLSKTVRGFWKMFRSHFFSAFVQNLSQPTVLQGLNTLTCLINKHPVIN